MEMSISPVHRILILLAVSLLAVTAFTISRGRSAEHGKQEAAAPPASPVPAPVHSARRAPQAAQGRAARQSRPAAKPRRTPRRAAARMSDEVVHAITAGRVVVLLLYGRNAADDDAARAAVHQLPRANG